MDKKGIASSAAGKVILAVILAALAAASGFIAWRSADRMLKEKRQENAEAAEMKKASSDIQWTNMKLLALSRKENMEFRKSIRKYLDHNLYGDVRIISIHEGSVSRKDGILSFQADVTTYGSFVSSYKCEMNSKGSFSYRFYRNSYQYNEDARKEGEKDYGYAD